MLQTTRSVWLPDPGGWMTGWARKESGNCLWSLQLWVACRRCRRNYRRLSVLSVISTSRALLSRSPVPCHTAAVLTKFHCTRYCIWRWPQQFILVTLTEASTAGDGTECLSHTSYSAGAGPSYLLSAISRVGSREFWNPVHCRRHGHFREPLLHQTDWCNHENSAVACFGSFLYVRSCENLNVWGRDRRCKTLENSNADEM